MNQVVLTGYLGDDPNSIFTSNGASIVTFQFAFRSSKDKTHWIKVNCFNKVGELAETYLHKGAKIGIVGTLQQETWQDKDGQNRNTFSLIANQIEFIKTDGRGFKDKENDSENQDENIPF